MKYLYTIFLLTIGTISLCQTENNDSITVKGITTNYNPYQEGNRINNVLINVYEYNTKITTYKSDSKGKFEFNISKNTYTVLEFVKDNFITKRILFDTRTSSNIKNVKPFNIELVMIKAKEGVDFSDLDFPITRIEYIEKYDDFNYVEKYTRLMLKKQDKILAKIKDAN